ncbi:Retinal-specific phospholipid-transporting ATPase ABCA4 [Lamellibrachia satsuma]|nr:Retinal-specific phospholipid-transporting ATPase ABCA4 [Lamellibrachia satsuma]
MCGQQLRLLLWKNFTLRKRQPFHVIVELLLPLILFLLLAWVKLRGTQSHNHECHYDGKPMPSAGPLPFFQGLLCTATNTCHRTIRPSEIAGVVDYYNSSLMSQLFLDVQEVLKNESQIEAVNKLLEDIVTLQNMQEKAASGKLDCTFRLGDVLINTTELTENAKKQNISLSDGSLQTLLMNATLNTSQLLQLITTQSILSSKTPDISKNLQKQICKKRWTTILSTA